MVAEALLEGMFEGAIAAWWLFPAFGVLLLLAAAGNALERKARKRRHRRRPLRR